ncbi:MAG: TerB family tellurite resistance protein [Prevotella sp.]|nr:TerB family tellurite resistance protein [Prevotella sp.]
MTIQELYFKTVFCCMACDGDIADKEVELIRKAVKATHLFDGLDVGELLNTYISEINANGRLFLSRYLNNIVETELTEEEEMTIVGLAIKMIEADNIIKYSEVQFFKKIRVRLSLSDEQILEKYPDKEIFLERDIDVYEEPAWDNTKFEPIFLNVGDVNKNSSIGEGQQSREQG